MEKKTSGDEIALSKTESEYITVGDIRRNLGEQYQYCSKSSSAENTKQDNAPLSSLKAIFLSRKGAGDGETIYKVTWDLKGDGTIVNIKVEIIEAVPEMADTEKPIIEEVKVTEITMTTIKIKVEAYDAEETDTSGCSDIEKYYYSKDNGTTWEPKDETGNEIGTSDSTYTFTGLAENTEYSIKVKVVDGAGNETISDAVTGKTKEGDWVDYAIDINGDTTTTNDWRLFYVTEGDGTGTDGNVSGSYASGSFTTTASGQAFLIAADYVESDNALLDLTTAEMYRCADYSSYSSYKYSVNWYNTSTRTDTLLSTGTHYSGNGAIDSNIASLFMYNLHYTTYPTQAQANTRATASLLDTTAWSNFVDTNYAEYATGGSTLEMWVAAWNKKYTTLFTAMNSTGYYIGLTENPTSYYQYVTSSYVDNSGYSDTIFFPHTSSVSSCSGYWLASPSPDFSGSLVLVRSNGSVNYDHYGNTYCGVRPVVSLSAGVTATYNSTTGIWSLSK